MQKFLKKYTVGTLSVLVATSLITTSVAAEEVIVNEMPTKETPAADGGYGYNGPTGANPVLPEVGGSGAENYGYTPPVQTTTPAPVPKQTTLAPAPKTTVESHVSQKTGNKYTEEEKAYIDNYLRELSKSLGGAPVGLIEGEADEILKKRRAGEGVKVQKPNAVATTVALAKKPTATENKITSKAKNDNLEHSVVQDKEIEKDVYSVKFVTLDKATGKKKVHDFKDKETNSKDKVDYSKEPAKVGFTPGASYAIVKLEDGLYGQLSVERRSGKKLITAKYDLLKGKIEKGSWEYKDEEVVEVKKEDKSPEQTTTTKSR